MVGEPRVPGAVARDVQHLHARPLAARDERLAPRGGHGLRPRAGETWKGVRARAGEDADRHDAQGGYSRDVFAALIEVPANVGYTAIFALIAIETMGVPVPAEAALIAAALL